MPQQISDLLSCSWPAALESAVKPLESTTWLCCLAVTTDRCNGDPARLRKLGRDRFFAAVRRSCPVWGAAGMPQGRQPVLRRADRYRGVAAQRCGALERVGLLMDDWRSVIARLAEVERRMVAVLDGLGLTELVTSIPGLSAVGAAVILAETGDLARFATARSVVKHAGLHPASASATLRGRTQSAIAAAALRAAAWRACGGRRPRTA